MVAHRFPRMREQELLYRSIFDATWPGREVTFRTLDIGSDKILPYMDKVEEENPALGWRAIRIGLDRPALLRSQIRAMLRAGGGRDLRIMFPMIAAIEEFRQAKTVVDQEIAYLARYNHRELPADVKLGIMLEVPSLLWQLDEICTTVDFVSVGSNDLLQYMFAADRENTRVSTRFDTLSPPVLRALKLVADKTRAHGTPLTLCGEMGGKPLEAIVLIALGFRGLSMSPAAIGPVKGRGARHRPRRAGAVRGRLGGANRRRPFAARAAACLRGTAGHSARLIGPRQAGGDVTGAFLKARAGS